MTSIYIDNSYFMFNILSMQGEVTGSSERCVALLTALRSLLQVTNDIKH